MSSFVEAGESPEHKRLVKALIEYLNGQGFATICAAYTGFKQCDKMENHTPDFEGQNADGLIAIGEAKTCEDLDYANTKEQFTVFASRKRISGKSNDKVIPFYILVTKGCQSKLAATLNSLGLGTKENIYRLSV
jgi:hypothetical protein